MYYKPHAANPDDPQLKGRIYNTFKGKFSSRATDVWMKTRYEIDSAFVNWLQAQRKRQGGGLSLANIKAEIRNDYIRAGDLWFEYQQSLGVQNDRVKRPELITENMLSAIAFKNKQTARSF